MFCCCGLTELNFDELLCRDTVLVESFVELVGATLQTLARILVRPLCRVEILLVLGRVLLTFVNLYGDQVPFNQNSCCKRTSATGDNAHLCHDGIESGPLLLRVLQGLFPIFEIRNAAFEGDENIRSQLLMVARRQGDELLVHCADGPDDSSCAEWRASACVSLSGATGQ